jgi:hypothetical protein
MSNDVAMFIYRALMNSGKKSEVIQKYSGTKSNWQSTTGVLVTCSDADLLLAILKQGSMIQIPEDILELEKFNQDGVGFDKILY